MKNLQFTWKLLSLGCRLPVLPFFQSSIANHMHLVLYTKIKVEVSKLSSGADEMQGTRSRSRQMLLHAPKAGAAKNYRTQSRSRIKIRAPGARTVKNQRTRSRSSATLENNGNCLMITRLEMLRKNLSFIVISNILSILYYRMQI